MANLIFEDDEFKILKGKDFILVRKDKPHHFHSHFEKLDGAKSILNLFYKRIKPQAAYFHEAMRRICTEDEFAMMRNEKIKQRYRNSRR